MSTDRIQELHEEKTKCAEEMKRMLEQGQDTWSADDEKRWDDLDNKFEENEKLIENLRQQAEREARLAQIEERKEKQKYTDRSTHAEMRANREGRDRGMTESEMRGLCFRAWMRPALATERQRWACAQRAFGYGQSEITLRAFEPGDTSGMGRESQLVDCRGGYTHNLKRVMEARAQSVGTATAGGHTVPDGVMQALEVALLQFGGMRRVASVSRTGDGRTIPWPTVNDTAAANKGEVISENNAANTQDVTFSQVTTTPLLYSSKYVPVSIQLMQDSNENMEALLGRLLGERIGRIQADHFADDSLGTGTASARAITLDATDASVALNADNAPNYANIIALKHACDPAYRGNATWAFADTVLSNIKQILDGNSRPLWAAGMAVGEPNTIDGDPYIVDQSMPTAAATGTRSMIYGDLSKYKIHDALDMQFRRLDELHALNHQVTFLAFMRTDARLLDAGTGPVVYATNP